MAQAEKRWTKDIMALSESALAECLEVTSEVVSKAASIAEMRQRGDGLRIILNELDQTRARAHGQSS